MADLPIGYTTKFNIAKFADGSNPGAAALNNNWDLIDSAIDGKLSTPVFAYPLYYDAVNAAVNLNYNTALFTLMGSGSGNMGAFDINTEGAFRFKSVGINSAPDGNNALKVDGTAYFTGSIYTDADIHFKGSVYQDNYTDLNINDHAIRLNKGGTTNSAIAGGMIILGDSDSQIASILWDGSEFVSDKDFALNKSLYMIDKAGDGYRVFANRNISGAEAVFDLSNIGTITTTGNIILGAQATGTTHAVRADRQITVNIGNSLTRTGNATQNLTSDPSYTLDAIQDIRTAASPTFVNFTLTAQATTTTQAVRADRTLTIGVGPSLTRTGSVTQNYTADLSYTFDTIQDIRTSASPTFNQLTLSAAGTTTTGAVRADRSITINGTTNQIISSVGSQNLTADRTWTLSLPQNIHTGAIPTFAGLTLTGSITSNMVTGIVTHYKSGVYTDSRTRSLYIQSFTETATGANNVYLLFGGEMDSSYTIASPKFKTWAAYPGFGIGKISDSCFGILSYKSSTSDWNPASPSYIMSFFTGGLVGINNIAPAEALDVTGNIKTNGNVILGLQATGTTHAVRADRSITINGTINQVISSTGGQDLTADRVWTLSLPQNIHTAATPTFAGLTINGTTTRLAVNRADVTGTVGFDFSTGGTYDWSFGMLTASSDTLSYKSRVYGNPSFALKNNGTVAIGGIINIADFVGATMVVTASRVGIGVTNPSTILHVGNGRVAIGTTDIGNVTTGIAAYGATNNTAYGYQAGQTTTNNISFGWISKTLATDGYGYIETYGGTNDLKIMRSGAGKIGIGIIDANPIGSKLSVYGNMSIGTNYAGTAAPTDGLIIKGAVGIGTSAPQRSLHVDGTGGTRIRITDFGTYPGGSGVEIGFDATGKMYLWNNQNSDFGIATNNIEAITILASGKVGLGNTSPAEKLDITGNIKLSGELYLSDGQHIISGSNTILTGTGGNTYIGYAGNTYLRATGGTPLSLYATSLNAQFSGNVGIKTGNPRGELDINGYLFIGPQTDLTDKRNYIISSHYNSSTEPEGTFLMGSYSGNGDHQTMIGGGASGWNATKEIYFYTAADNITRSGTLRMTIDSSGNVILANQATATTHALRAGRILTMTGTANQVIISAGGQDLTADRTWTFSLPQNIHTSATPTFGGLTLNGALILGTNNINSVGSITASGTYTGGNLSSSAFASGWTGTGFRLDYGVSIASKSTLTVDNLTVRGTMSVYELLIQTIRATNGNLFVSSVAKIISVNSTTIIFDNPDNSVSCPFVVGDLIQAQTWDQGGTQTRIVQASVSTVTGFTITIAYNSGSGVFQAGDTVVRKGSSVTGRQGHIYMASDDTNAPFIRISDGVSTWAADGTMATIKTQIGNLAGLTSTNWGSLTGYGGYLQNLYAEGNVNIAGTLYALLGGFGGTVASPIVKISSSGIYVNSGGSSTATTTDGNYIGNFTPSATFDGTIQNSAGIQGYAAGTKVFYIDSTGAKLGGWNLGATSLGSDSGYIKLNSGASPSIEVTRGASTSVKTYYNSATDWGISGTNDSGTIVFQLGYVNKIAGWTFDNAKLTGGNARLYATGVLSVGSADAWATANCIYIDGVNSRMSIGTDFTYTGGILTVNKITATTGTIGNFNITASSIQTGNYNTSGTLYFGSSGISLSDKFSVSYAGYLTAINGSIAGWTISTNYLGFTDASTDIRLTTTNKSIYAGRIVTGQTYYEYSLLGAMFWANSWQNAYGLSVGYNSATPNNGLPIFAAGVVTETSGTVTIGGSTTISAGSSFLHIGNSTKYFVFDGTTIKWNGGNTSLDTAGKLTTTSASIGGWTVNATKIYAGNINIDSAGSINGNYTAGSAGWSIKNDGTAEFNNVTVRGSVYSSAGTIGGFTINSTSIQTGAFNTVNTLYFGTSGLSISNVFYVNSGGVLVSTSALIGGWSIDATTISAGTVSTADYMTLNSATRVIQIGTATVADGSPSGGGVYLGQDPTSGINVFFAGDNATTDGYILYDGYNATVKGGVYASYGSIANFTIQTDCISTGSYNTSGKLYFGTSGLSLSNTFSVSAAGALTSTSGAIGGFNITSTSIYRGNATYNTSGTGNIYMGTSGISISNAFTVDNTGAMTASMANITGGVVSIYGGSTGNKQKIDINAGAFTVTATDDSGAYRSSMAQAIIRYNGFELLANSSYSGTYQSFRFYTYLDGSSNQVFSLQQAGAIVGGVTNWADMFSVSYASGNWTLNYSINVKSGGYPLCRWRGRLSSAPSTGLVAGDIYQDSSSSMIYLYDGSAWHSQFA